MSKKKELYNEIVKSKKIGELADKVNTLPDSIKVVCQTIDLTVKLCNEMDKRDHEKYLKKIQPLLIIVEDVNNQLKKQDVIELYVTLLNYNELLLKKDNKMALEIAAVPVLTGEASDRFDQLMEESEERRGSVDFSREIDEARAILSKANF